MTAESRFNDQDKATVVRRQRVADLIEDQRSHGPNEATLLNNIVAGYEMGDDALIEQNEARLRSLMNEDSVSVPDQR